MNARHAITIASPLNPTSNVETRRPVYPEGVFLPRSRGLPVLRLPPVFAPARRVFGRAQRPADTHPVRRDRNGWNGESRGRYDAAIASPREPTFNVETRRSVYITASRGSTRTIRCSIRFGLGGPQWCRRAVALDRMRVARG